jgi:hypothetical protein
VKRRLFNALAAVSLALFVATVAAWVRSHFATEDVIYEPPIGWTQREYCVGWYRNHFYVNTLEVDHVPGWRWQHTAVQPPPEFPHIGGAYFTRGTYFLGFQEYTFVYPPGYPSSVPTMQTFVVPMWMIAIITAIPLGLWWRSQRYRRLINRRRNNLCARCGYDLRATPVRCPECGEVPGGTAVAN